MGTIWAQHLAGTCVLRLIDISPLRGLFLAKTNPTMLWLWPRPLGLTQSVGCGTAVREEEESKRETDTENCLNAFDKCGIQGAQHWAKLGCLKYGFMSTGLAGV